MSYKNLLFGVKNISCNILVFTRSVKVALQYADTTYFYVYFMEPCGFITFGGIIAPILRCLLSILSNSNRIFPAECQQGIVGIIILYRKPYHRAPVGAHHVFKKESLCFHFLND